MRVHVCHLIMCVRCNNSAHREEVSSRKEEYKYFSELDFSTMFLVHNSPETKFLVYLKLSVNETQVSTVIPHRRMYPT